MRNNIGLWLAKRAFLSPAREAYVGDDGHRFTFRALNERCNRAANAFVGAGVLPGERVALLLMNSPEFVEAYFALAKIGAVVVPLNWRLVADELAFILKDSGATRLIFDAEFAETVAELHARGEETDVGHWLQTGTEAAYFATGYVAFRDAASADEPALGASNDAMLYIMYTSGTTGLPKGIPHTLNTAIRGLQAEAIKEPLANVLEPVDRYFPLVDARLRLKADPAPALANRRGGTTADEATVVLPA